MKTVVPLSGALACLILTVACGGADLPQRQASSRMGSDQQGYESSGSVKEPFGRSADEQEVQSKTVEAEDQANEGSLSAEDDLEFYGTAGQPVDLSALTVSLLQGLKKDLTGEAAGGTGSGASFHLVEADPFLPSEKTRIVLQAAVDLLVELGLERSEDVVVVAPALLSGALSALESLVLEDSITLASALTKSILVRSGGLAEALQLAAHLRGVSLDVAFEELVKAVTHSTLPSLAALPIEPGRLPAAIEELTRSIVGSIVSRIAAGSAAGTVSGGLRILSVSQMSQLLDSVIGTAVSSLGQARFPSLGGDKSAADELSRLTEIVQAVVHGGARGLGELDVSRAGAGGLQAGDLPALARAVAARALQSALIVVRTQESSSARAMRDEMAALAEGIAQGLISGLDRFRVPGFNAAILQQTVDAVSFALVSAMRDLDVEDLTEQEIEGFATRVASGTTGALASLDLSLFFTLTREDLVQAGAAAAARAVANLPLIENDETVLGRLMAAVTSGACQGVSDWAAGSLEGDLLGKLLKSVTAGVTEVVGDVEVEGRNIDDLAGMTLTIVKAAGQVAGQLQSPETQQSVVENILNGILAGAVESLEASSEDDGAAASLQNHLNSIDGGLGGLIGGLFSN